MILREQVLTILNHKKSIRKPIDPAVGIYPTSAFRHLDAIRLTVK